MKATRAALKVCIIWETWSGFGARGLRWKKKNNCLVLFFFLDVHREVFWSGKNNVMWADNTAHRNGDFNAHIIELLRTREGDSFTALYHDELIWCSLELLNATCWGDVLKPRILPIFLSLSLLRIGLRP